MKLVIEIKPNNHAAKILNLLRHDSESCEIHTNKVVLLV